MGRQLKYRAGSYYMQDDRTGLVQRADQMKRQWDGLMVDERRWETRQPQDFVRGVRDEQTVPVARPKPAPTFVGPVCARLLSQVNPGDAVIHLENSAGISQGDLLRIMLDTGELFSVRAGPVNGASVLLSRTFLARASAGNLVYDLGPSAPLPFILDRSVLDGSDVLG